eukprot:TRINITY_DN25548_c0_g1_i1.p4 TRINITY_DN25548_c0_g1~~TRINITY_DN25548_c0_g1_i1.p4  ORF type:complete len:154 (+),score=1.18 TRINITY_DN25548_c0_g1_i1:501-962(+)
MYLQKQDTKFFQIPLKCISKNKIPIFFRFLQNASPKTRYQIITQHTNKCFSNNYYRETTNHNKINLERKTFYTPENSMIILQQKSLKNKNITPQQRVIFVAIKNTNQTRRRKKFIPKNNENQNSKISHHTLTKSPHPSSFYLNVTLDRVTVPL